MVEVEDFLPPANLRLGMAAESKAELFEELGAPAAD